MSKCERGSMAQPAGGWDRDSEMPRRARSEWLAFGGALALFLLTAARPALGQTQCLTYSGNPIGYENPATGPTRTQNCNDGARTHIYRTLNSGPWYELRPPGCNPASGSCTVVALVHAIAPGHSQNPLPPPGGNSFFRVQWLNSSGTVTGECGLPTAVLDFGELDGKMSASFSCTGGLSGTSGAYTFRSRMSPCAVPILGPYQTDTPFVLDTPTLTARFCGTPPPPKPSGCNGGAECQECPAGGSGGDPATQGSPKASSGGSGGGVSIGGGGAGHTPPGQPGATLRYLAGGAGEAGTPGDSSWRGTLGRYWSHEFAERVVEDPDESHVWLITKHGTFREYSNLEAGSGLRRYQAVAPSNEHRQLYYDTSTGRWELHGLVGQVTEFDSAGLWTESRDRSGNTWSGTYTSGKLTSVTFPDGQSETFAYALNGKLASITRVGAGGSPNRTWNYAYAGDDLVRIEYPDGTAREFSYANAWGYLDGVTLYPSSGAGSRIERRWEYDSEGNAVRTWRGAAAFSDTAAVDKWELEFDDPADPTETTVTDPLGGETVYVFDRDPDGTGKPRVLSVSGPCPGCGTGPDTTYDYDDVNHPLLPTTVTDGDGTETVFTYDANGRIESKTEAADVVSHPHLPRITEWLYDPNFPGYPTVIEGPTAVGETHTRSVTMVYDSTTGDLESRTIAGEEATYGTGTFSLTTTYDNYNAAGGVGTIDPPGYSTADQTTFTYTANGLLVETQTDPVGTVTFAYDAFRRRVRVEDPNGAVTDTQYDTLDRPTMVIRRESDGGGTVDPDDPPSGTDLATRYFYTTYGDLFCVKSPNGAGTQHVYDAAGRLTELIRGTAVANPSSTVCLETNQLRERARYVLDGAGHRIEEKLQRTTTSSWPNPVTSFDRYTEWDYSTMCHLDLKTDVIAVDGSGNITNSAVTEYAYDCDGNLEKVWDPNHPSASFPTQPSTTYAYDDLNRLTSMTQPWGGGGGGTVTTSYEYDVQDHLVEVTDGEGTVTSYVYSDRDLMTSQISEVSGTTSYSYNQHGELVSETDARSVTVTRTLDAADRVTFVDYPTNALDVTYTWGTSAIDCEIGRLAGITRNSETIDYAYDCFGRMEQDGDLAYTYNADGDRSTITYPGSLVATYTYDKMNRPTSLVVQEGAGSPQTVVLGSPQPTYEPFGPLSSLRLDLGTDRNEVREYDLRYAPTSIRLQAISGSPPAQLFTWNYSTDAVGNVTEIDQVQPSAVTRTFDYQDWQYYLTYAYSGDPNYAGNWSYDRVGNREFDGGGYYTYQQNAAQTGNTSELGEYVPGIASSYVYSFDAAGYLEQLAYFPPGGRATTIDVTFDDAGQLAFFDHINNKDQSLTYDGRGFLSGLFDSSGTPQYLESTYTSEGILHSLLRTVPSLPSERINVLYFAGRPIAIWKKVGTGTATLTRIVTDHLGTPAASIQQAGTAVDWYGGFAPFGEDWQAGTAQDSLAKGIFLRMPGQWSDPLWSDATYPMELFYNVHRWYEPATGRYTSPDPRGLDALRRAELFELQFGGLYSYADGNPLTRIDPLGDAWYDWLPSPIKCYIYWKKCGREALKCAEKVKQNQNEEELAAMYNMGGGRVGAPIWDCCYASEPSCKKHLKYCGAAAKPGPPAGWPKKF